MDKGTTLKVFRPLALGALVALWTTAAALAAPTPTRHLQAAAQAAAMAGSVPDALDATYGAMERLAQALHGVIVPEASGGLPKLRGYADAAALANEVLGIANTLRDRNAVAAAAQSAVEGPDAGRRAVLADLQSHFPEFSSIIDRLEQSQHGKDAQSRFTALVDLARLLDVEPRNKAVHKFNPATIRGQLADKKKVREPLLTVQQFQAAAVTTAPIGVGAAPTAADLASTDEVQLTPDVVNLAQQLGNNPVAIRNWVYSNIEFVPSFGSTQSSQRTLLARRGNAFDTSSLLIALLRSAGIPARYVYGTVDLPVERVVNWLGNVTDGNAAADLLVKCGVPTVVVTVNGALKFLRIEHVWVEAFVDFSPARGARTTVADTWAPMDASFKTYAADPPVPGLDDFKPDFTSLQNQLLAGAQLGTDWITGIQPSAFKSASDQFAQQLESYAATQNPADAAIIFGRRNIVAESPPILPASLPYAIRSDQTYRYDALPATLQQSLSVRFYSTSFDADSDAPALAISLPLARLGTSSLQVEYRGATAADAAAIQQYANANSATLSASTLNVVPQLKLSGAVLAEGPAALYGTQQYWRAAVLDPMNAFSALPDASVFPAGTAIALVVDSTGVTPDYAAAVTARYGTYANLPIGEALGMGGLQYFLLHDVFDAMVARARRVGVVRLPSVAAFATAVKTSYFFGLPRTASTQGFLTDVKGLRFAVAAPTPAAAATALMQMGTLGSLAEGLTWSLLTGRDVAGSLSAATLLLRANEAKIPIYELNQSNAALTLPGLALNEDDRTDIQNAINAGQIVLVPAREMRIGAWSGVGYIVLDPTSGAGVWRVSGGLNGAIDVGCIQNAISLNVLCKLMVSRLLRAFIASLNPGTLLALLAEEVLVAAFPPLGIVVAAVTVSLAVISITMQVLEWVRSITNELENLTPDQLATLGIAAINDFICSLGSPCFGSDFFGDIERHWTWDGFKQDFLGSFIGGIADFGGGAPGEYALGNPISIGNGIKWQWERDYDGAGPYPLTFVRTYNSTQINGSVIGNKWTHTYQSSIHVAPAPLGSDATPSTAVAAVLVTHGDGTYSQYVRRGSSYVPDSNIPEPLVRLTDAGGNTTGWELVRISDETEHYDGTGRLQWIRNRAGLRHTLRYNTEGQLTQVSDDFGRSLQLAYAADGHLESLTDPANRQTTYSYENGNLTSVRYPDTKTRGYLYEDVQLRSYLTGIVDERGVRYATFAYDYRGRAILSTHNGGAGRISISYGDNTSTVKDALGTERTYKYTLINQRQYLVQVDQPCSAGCASGGVSTQSFDGNGFVAARTDFNNNVTAFVHDARGLITNRTEASNSALTRTTIAQWHPAYLLPTQVLEPLPNGASRIDTFDYDAQGNLQAVTANAGGDIRKWTFTYNAHGQVLTATSPRTDVTSIVRYQYEDSSGNRSMMTDAAGHETHYTEYDAHGRLKQKIDSNGLITRYGYDLRGRLTMVTEQAAATDAGETTRFDYDDAGELTRLTLPDDSFLSYTYDDTQRLTDISDGLGNGVHYTLDGLGNRTREDTNDPSHLMSQTLSRVIDALGRVQELHGAQANEITRFSYDPVGNEQSATDPLSHTTSSTYDALNRLKETKVLDTTDPAHAQIGYGYDVRDNLTSVTDPRQLETSYTYSGFDELTTLSSPDTGLTQYQYDPAGNLIVQTDARGKRGVYRYDAADRLTQIRYGQADTGTALASTEEVVEFGFDEPSGGAGAIGRLTHADVAGTPLGTSHLGYAYDAHGRVTAKSQQLGNSPTLTTRTHYNARGQRDEVTLPSGAVIAYAYGADGRVTTIAVNGIVIVRDVAYFPFGDPAAWTEAASGGTSYTRQYDTDGRITSHRDGGVNRQLAYDPASRITAAVDSGVGGTANWIYGYDNQDRLTSASNSATTGATSGVTQGFGYDPTGNRTQATNGGTTIAYTTDSRSNRLTQVGGVARNYDAAGNTTDWVGPTGAVHADYSARNRLSQTHIGAPTATYAYDAWGERVGKQGATLTQFVYDEDGHLIGEYDPTGRQIEETLWLDDTPVAVLRLRTGAANGSAIGGGSATAWQGLPVGGVEAFWIEPDQLDSPRAIVNQNHQLVWQWDSDPFGTTLANENPSSFGAFSYGLRFPGQYFDAETQTHYNYFRDYEPATGRYAQNDPIGFSGGVNPFLYAHASPLSHYDEQGLAVKPIVELPGQLNRKKDRRFGNFSIVNCNCIRQQFIQSEGFDPTPTMITGRGGTLVNPPGYEWHHPVDKPNLVWLLKKCDHRAPENQSELHPRRQGGIKRYGGK